MICDRDGWLAERRRRVASEEFDGALPTLPAFFTQAELARRWRVSVRTLDRRRAAGTGPAWLRLNGRILYPIEDVLAYERAQVRRPARPAQEAAE